MYDLIWDFFQHHKLGTLAGKQKLTDGKFDYHDAKANNAETRLRELERKHEQLKLVTLALWSLLRDHSGLMESDLRKYVEETDLLDGKQDGKVAHKKTKTVCTDCNREIFNTASVCPYCGAFNKVKDPFERA